MVASAPEPPCYIILARACVVRRAFMSERDYVARHYIYACRRDEQSGERGIIPSGRVRAFRASTLTPQFMSQHLALPPTHKRLLY